MRRPKSRGVAARRHKTEEGGGKSPEKPAKESTKATTNRGKRVKAPPKPKPEPEFFPDKRRFEDLWEAAFPVGTEWDNMDKIKEINWNFSNLENAFEEGGELCGKPVYLFGSTEPQLLALNGEQKVVLVPIVVVVVSPIPPSDKIGIKSVQKENEEIVPMSEMKLGWLPYFPEENRQKQVERLKTNIFTLGCTQRRSALKHLKLERVKRFDYCLPYLQPLKADEDEDDTVVNIMYPFEPPVVCDFDWDLDDLEEFTTELIKEESLAEDQKDTFKDYVKEQVRERKKAQKQAKEARKKAIEDMNPETKAAFENMRFYKFYPVQTPDTPDISNVKVSYINRYYGKAHVVV